MRSSAAAEKGGERMALKIVTKAEDMSDRAWIHKQKKPHNMEENLFIYIYLVETNHAHCTQFSGSSEILRKKIPGSIELESKNHYNGFHRFLIP